MSQATPYTAEAVPGSNDELADVRLHIEGKTWHLWGRHGRTRETELAAKVMEETLPVLIGAGLGHCLQAFIDRGQSVAVVDKETEIDRITGLRAKFAKTSGIFWVDCDTPQEGLDRLTRWQAENGGKPFAPIVLPLYIRLDRNHYGVLADTLKSNTRGDFWSQTRYPKFQSIQPRILFLDSSYFLCGEILASLPRLGVEHHVIKLDGSGTGSQEFIETLLKCVLDFKPDFVLTVNHFGLDREGKLSGLLQDLGLPLASWFVDNPHLILHQYAHCGEENTALFTYDAGNLDVLQAKGFPHVHYLPLATDPVRFKPGLTHTAPATWASDISFVGNSMVRPVAESLQDAALPESLRGTYTHVAEKFEASGELSVEPYLKKYLPEWHAALTSLPTAENRLALESLITWEATRQYRLRCVEQLLQFTPLIVGDIGWKTLLGSDSRWRHLPGLDYYAELPRFYPMSKINFNCTSRQMIGAVNQRVFDVPACGGFILTDYRAQMENLFDLDTEAIVYRDPNDIPQLINTFLADEGLRTKISAAARRRILAEHTYEIRLTRLIDIMRRTFAENRHRQ